MFVAYDSSNTYLVHYSGHLEILLFLACFFGHVSLILGFVYLGINHLYNRLADYHNVLGLSRLVS